MAEAARDLHSDQEFYVGFDDGVQGLPCHATSIGYLRGYREGRLMADLPTSKAEKSKKHQADATAKA